MSLQLGKKRTPRAEEDFPLFTPELPGVDAASPKSGLPEALDGNPVAAATVEHADTSRVELVNPTELMEQRQVKVLHAMTNPDYLVL